MNAGDENKAVEEGVLMTTEGRIDGVFQKTDPWMQYDPDIAKAGPMAEFLHRRGLDIIRRNLWEGTIRKPCFGELADGIPAARKHLQALIEAGVWVDEGDKWRIRNWGKWNLTDTDREERSRKRSAAGKKGMHERWHTIDKPDEKCQLCVNQGWV